MDEGPGDAKRPVGERTDDWTATRRGVLAAGGAVALGGLAGCSALDGLLEGASDQLVQRRTASPAGFYTGAESLDTSATLYRSGPVDVRFVPPSLQAEGQRIEIDGWSTSSTTKAQDYNSSRSNKPSTIWVPDPHDDDDDGDGILTLVAALDAERALIVYLSAALAAVDNRDSEGINDPFDGFTKISEIRSDLDDCESDSCRSVAENLARQQDLVSEAEDAVAAGEWDRADQSLRQARRIAHGDIDAILGDLDSDGDGILDAAAPLYDYLDGEPTVAEDFVVSLPDARVRGGGPSLAAEITPRRVLDYFTGEKDAEGCGEREDGVAVHQDLTCRDLLTTRLDEEEANRRQVTAFESGESGVVATGTAALRKPPRGLMCIGSGGGGAVASSIARLNSWGTETTAGGVRYSETFLLPVVATPPDCPCPMPALFHLSRIRHEDQLRFVGGWVIDDGALYENSATVLTFDGPRYVLGVTRSDIDEGGVRFKQGNDTVVRKKPGRTTYGNITLSTPYDAGDGYLPAEAHPVCTGADPYCYDVQSVEAAARHAIGDCPGQRADVPAWAVTTALDAPLLHLVGAADASNDVKFKAGAELSKAVN